MVAPMVWLCVSTRRYPFAVARRVTNYRNEGKSTVSAQAVEEELLRSIEEVEDRINVFRKRVRAVLASAQSDGTEEGGEDLG